MRKIDFQMYDDIKIVLFNVSGVAKWSHIVKFYEVDKVNPNFVFAPALKQEHLNPNTKQKMKVKLAAQVFSHTVAAGMMAKISNGKYYYSYEISYSIIVLFSNQREKINVTICNLKRICMLHAATGQTKHCLQASKQWP